MKRALLLSALALASAAGAASAEPCVKFEAVRTDLTLQYDPFSPRPTVRPFVLRVFRKDPTISGVKFALEDPNPSRGRSRIGPAGPFGYDIVWTGDIGQSVFFVGETSLAPVTTGVTVGFAGRSDMVEVPLVLRIPPGQPVPASRQVESLRVAYECTSGVRPGPQQQQSDNRVQIRLDIPHYFGAFVGTPGRTHGEIDFGVLKDADRTEEKHAAITAVSTVPYTIRVRTKGGSELHRTPDSHDGIPYRMRLGDIDVADDALLTCPVPQTTLGDTESLKVRLDDSHLHDLQAGAYRDIVTLTFTPLDAAPAGDRCAVRP